MHEPEAGRTSASPPVVMEHVTKRFPGVLANDDVSLEIRAGEVHAIIGENGAGKSTLMRILYGMYPADQGRITIDGEEVRIHSPRDAIAHGIGMVHQHFVLVDPFTVTENMILGDEGGPMLHMEDAEQQVDELADPYGFDIDPRAVVEDLSVGEEQRVEILKALYRGVDILILDEPTAVLTPAEAQELFTNLRAPAATTARRSCSSATSSTRCCRSPIASRCCAAAWSSARRRRPRPTRRGSPR